MKDGFITVNGQKGKITTEQSLSGGNFYLALKFLSQMEYVLIVTKTIAPVTRSEEQANLSLQILMKPVTWYYIYSIFKSMAV